jgi:tRNA/tmRNA/rRNA uracil-C5-methylase (TrmA/RlmC/RlmD family)
LKVGDRVEVDISEIAHGGHCVARADGRVIFVRHAIPGERAVVEITEVSKNFARGESLSVIKASPDRVPPKCEYAIPGGCGGCDFQHIAPNRQRELKAAVIAEQFARLAKLNLSPIVEKVEPVWNWRTRMEFTVSQNRKLAMFRSRSNDLVEIGQCDIAGSEIDIAKINGMRLPIGKKVDVAIDTNGDVVTTIEGRSDFRLVNQEVNGFKFQISPESFWQSHKSAPKVLVDAVRNLTDVNPGDHLLDLYAGVGLFSSGFVDQIGPGGRITMVEESPIAIVDARRIFAEYANVEILEGKVEKVLRKLARANRVIIDPPRSGAGEVVVDLITGLEPETLTYVACDPAALARDTAYLLKRGYQLEKLRAFDLFPMTHHVECVARFIKG